MAFKLNLEKRESEIKSIRFSLSMIQKIEEILAGTELTFSDFVLQACEYALSDIEKQSSKKVQKN